MKKRRDSVKIDLMRHYDIYNTNLIKIDKEDGQYYFEIGKEITTDLAEAISLMMRCVGWNDKVWDLRIDQTDSSKIDPEKCLYWLTGGRDEWEKMENYTKSWCDSYLIFQEEFGIIVVEIIKSSLKFKDIRDGFIKYLGMPRLYDFAINKGIVS